MELEPSQALEALARELGVYMAGTAERGKIGQLPSSPGLDTWLKYEYMYFRRPQALAVAICVGFWTLVGARSVQLKRSEPPHEAPA